VSGRSSRASGLVVAVALSLGGCDGPLGPPDASLRIRVDIDRLPDPLPEDPSDFQLHFRGQVTALSFARQEYTLAGFDVPEHAITVLTDDGSTLSLGVEARLDGQALGPTLRADVGDLVTVTLAQVSPFWVESALLVEGPDGLIVAAAEGALVGLGPLEGRLRVRSGARAQRTFNHPCGRGRALTLDVTADGTAAVPMNASASIAVDGVDVELLNVGSWVTEERRGFSCADFVPPFRWVAWRP